MILLNDIQSEPILIDDLTPHPMNARQGDIKVIAESLETIGQFRRILVNRGTYTGRPMEILAGHHVVKAARELHWDTLMVDILDVDDETGRRILVADNHTSDLGTYDDQLLAELLASLPDLDGTGYTESDLEALANSLVIVDPDFDPDNTEDVRLDRKGVVDCPQCGFTFTPTKYTTRGDDEE